MFARLTIVPVKSDKIDETIKIYEENVIPAAKSQKGFRGAYLLTDRKTGKGATIIFFDTKENMLANEESGLAQEQRDKFKDYWVGQYIVDRYEVCAQI